MQRMAMVIGLKPEKLEDYKKLHAAAWPGVLAALSAANIHNYSIFLREPEHILFGYWEYHGNDFAADAAKIAADPITQEWWRYTDPCQERLPTAGEGEWWAALDEIFHHD